MNASKQKKTILKHFLNIRISTKKIFYDALKTLNFWNNLLLPLFLIKSTQFEKTGQ